MNLNYVFIFLNILLHIKFKIFKFIQIFNQNIHDWKQYITCAINTSLQIVLQKFIYAKILIIFKL